MPAGHFSNVTCLKIPQAQQLLARLLGAFAVFIMVFICLLGRVWSGLGHPVQIPLCSLWIKKLKGLKLIEEPPFAHSCKPAVRWLAMQAAEMQDLTGLQRRCKRICGCVSEY